MTLRVSAFLATPTPPNESESTPPATIPISRVLKTNETENLSANAIRAKSMWSAYVLAESLPGAIQCIAVKSRLAQPNIFGDKNRRIRRQPNRLQRQADTSKRLHSKKVTPVNVLCGMRKAPNGSNYPRSCTHQPWVAASWPSLMRAPC